MGRPRKEPRERARSVGIVKTSAVLKTAAAVKPPSWLRDSEALSVWANVATELNSMRFLADADANTFGRYCTYFADWLRYKRAVFGNETINTPMTRSTPEHPMMMVRDHPLFKRIKDCEMSMLALEDRFGLSAKSRNHIVAQMADRRHALAPLFGDDELPFEAKPLNALAALGDDDDFGCLNGGVPPDQVN
jgi:P27 family predicted phage terminase small subunit